MCLLARLKAWSELGKDLWILSLSALVANSLNAGFAQYLTSLIKELGASYDLAALVISVSRSLPASIGREGRPRVGEEALLGPLASGGLYYFTAARGGV